MTTPPARPFASSSGPGPIAPDGSPVRVYAAAEPAGEPELIVAAIPPSSDILELGAGAGRITHALVALGHRLIAVDESAEMLQFVRGAATVHGAIEDLVLGRRFPVVLLASYLVNVPDDALRRRFLQTCARHLAPGGRLIVQRQPPGWYARIRPYSYARGRVVFSMVEVVKAQPGLLSGTLEFKIGDSVWRTRFRTRQLDNAEFEDELRAAGLSLEAYLDVDEAWALARPSPTGVTRRGTR